MRNRGLAFLLLALATAGVAYSQPPATNPAAGGGNLKIDFGPAGSGHPPLTYAVAWKQGMDPVQYLQAATKLQPPLTYRCVGQDPVKPCYLQHGDCSVTEINGVKGGSYGGKQYLWIWEIDGNQGALPACIFTVNSQNNVIGFKLLEQHLAKPH
jgi:hypothetical protein